MRLRIGRRNACVRGKYEAPSFEGYREHAAFIEFPLVLFDQPLDLKYVPAEHFPVWATGERVNNKIAPEFLKRFSSTA